MTGRERCSGLSSNGHRRPLGAACMPGTRLQVAGTKAVGILFPPRGVGRIRTSVTEKGPTCPHPPKKPPAHFPSAERLLPKLGFFFISVLGKVSVEFPFYRNLNGGSEAEVKCPSHLDDECKSQGSI